MQQKLKSILEKIVALSHKTSAIISRYAQKIRAIIVTVTRRLLLTCKTHWPAVRERLEQYALLIRLDRPVGIFLLLWPTLWGLWIAAKHSKKVVATLKKL